MASSFPYKQQSTGRKDNDSTENYKSPPIRTWKKFPPSNCYPDSASTPYQPNNRIDSLCISPLNRLRRNPCALSPIDRIKLGVIRRGRDICKSFELNQTCPIPTELSPRRLTRSVKKTYGQDGVVPQLCYAHQETDVSLSSIYSSNPSCPSSLLDSLSRPNRQPLLQHRPKMEKIRVDGANGLRFSARRIKGGFSGNSTSSPFSSVISSGCHGIASTSTTDSIVRLSKSEINPNKAVFTINSSTSRILIVNKNACDMLGYSTKELCKIEFSDLLVNKTKGHVSALAEGQLNTEDGTLVLLSGKVVEMITKTGSTIAVSLWIRQIDTEGRCLAVAEPVERRVARLSVADNGLIIKGDYEAMLLFQMDDDDFKCKHVNTLIPAIKLPDVRDPHSTIPKSVHKQKATGRTKDGISFPLCLIIDSVRVLDAESEDPNPLLDNVEEEARIAFSVTVFVFNNLSGLLVIDHQGIIESCNHQFSMLMFGYAQSKIIGQHIANIIPNFGLECHTESNNRSRNATISSLENGEESETETDHIVRMGCAADPVKYCLDFSSSKVNSLVSELSDDFSNIKSLSSDTRSVPKLSQDQPLQSDIDACTCIPIAKSLSENFLCPENDENGKNGRKASAGARKMPPHSIHQAGNYSLSVCDNTFEDDYSQLMDNEILTPVNEADHCMGSNAERNSDLDSSKGLGSHVREHEVSHSQNSAVEGANEGLRPNSPSVKHDSDQRGGRAMLIHDGRYKGEAVHNDGNVIDIIYSVSMHSLPSGRVHCLWVSRDPDTEFAGPHKTGGEDGFVDADLGDEEDRNQNLTLTFDSVNSTVENSLGQAIKANANTSSARQAGKGIPAVPTGSVVAAAANSRPNSMSLLSQCEEELVTGEFSKHYTTLKQIGKGAYGYVKMAYRNSDRLLVIAKFILKEKLCPQFMVITEDKREIPMEIYLLTTVKHPNIVNVHSVYENERFYQMVMEKHGSGMDLFEFIDRLTTPMDEKLACYIFRQIANAVDYLHSLQILHRDLKDENIIIDQNFQVKLIDFGSATFLESGKLFSTFYGTTEYCSPEVLSGNKYAGPELELWSLGVTLYVIMFFENPFVDIEETLHATLVIPQKVSAELESLLLRMLDKNPTTRCTMRELISDPWLEQEINPAQFNFAWVVSCEAFESNPDKYYTGPAVSSGTALSTTSPQNSLSLVDGDSMLDVDGVEDEEELLEEDQDPVQRGGSFEAADNLDGNENIPCDSLPTQMKCVGLEEDSLHKNIKRKTKTTKKKKKRRGAAAKKKNGDGPVAGGLALSKSENNLFLEGFKSNRDGNFEGGIVSSMCDLQLDLSVIIRPIIDLSKTQVLNVIDRDVEPKVSDANAESHRVWSKEADLAANKSSNRSFQILSVTRCASDKDLDDDNDEYDNDSWELE